MLYSGLPTIRELSSVEQENGRALTVATESALALSQLYVVSHSWTKSCFLPGGEGRREKGEGRREKREKRKEKGEGRREGAALCTIFSGP